MEAICQVGNRHLVSGYFYGLEFGQVDSNWPSFAGLQLNPLVLGEFDSLEFGQVDAIWPNYAGLQVNSSRKIGQVALRR